MFITSLCPLKGSIGTTAESGHAGLRNRRLYSGFVEKERRDRIIIDPKTGVLSSNTVGVEPLRAKGEDGKTNLRRIVNLMLKQQQSWCTNTESKRRRG